MTVADPRLVPAGGPALSLSTVGAIFSVALAYFGRLSHEACFGAVGLPASSRLPIELSAQQFSHWASSLSVKWESCCRAQFVRPLAAENNPAVLNNCSRTCRNSVWRLSREPPIAVVCPRHASSPSSDMCASQYLAAGSFSAAKWSNKLSATASFPLAKASLPNLSCCALDSIGDGTTLENPPRQRTSCNRPPMAKATKNRADRGEREFRPGRRLPAWIGYSHVILGCNAASAAYRLVAGRPLRALNVIALFTRRARSCGSCLGFRSRSAPGFDPVDVAIAAKHKRRPDRPDYRSTLSASPEE